MLAGDPIWAPPSCHQLARIPIGASWQRRLEQERY
jgi:hypothetical protein